MILKAGIILVALSVLVGEMVRQFRVRRDARLRSQPSALGLSGAEAARQVLERAGVEGVEVVEANGLITNEYVPEAKTLRLAPQNFHGENRAAVGTAMHVAGHALQVEAGYRPLRWRRTAIRLTTFGTPLAFLLALPLIVFQARLGLLMLGVMWAFIRLNNLLTLPIEIDASARAKDLLLGTRMLSRGKELNGLEEMFRAAEVDKFSGFLHFWTYIFSAIFPWKKR